MDLKLALHRPSGVQDVTIRIEPDVTVGALAERVLRTDPSNGSSPSEPEGPVTLAVRTPAGWSALRPSDPISDAGLRSGLTTTVVPVGRSPESPGDDPVVAVLTVLTGRDRGREFPLRAGEVVLGRGAAADVALSDRLVSKRHALLRIGHEVRLIDHNSANGTKVDGTDVGAARLTPQSRVTIGDTVIRVRLLRTAAVDAEPSEVAFNRPPRVEPVFSGLQEEIAEPPQRPAGQPLPLFGMFLPLVMAFAIYEVTRSGLAAAFLALSSVLMIGTFVEQKVFRRRAHRRAVAAYRRTLGEQQARFNRARAAEVAARRFEHPSLSEVRAAIIERTPVLWARRAESAGFLQARLGTATRPSRSRLTPPDRPAGELADEIAGLAAEFTEVADVPLAVDLRIAGALGVCGPGGLRDDAARGIVLHLVGLHSPQDLIVSALTSASAAEHWAWLRWLPHLAPAPRIGGAALGADAESCRRILTAVEMLVAERGAVRSTAGTGPALLLVVDDDAPVERGRLVQLAEQGAAAGVHLLWSADDVAKLPAACRSYLQLGADRWGAVGDAAGGELVTPVRTEGIDAATAESLARLLAPVADAGAAIDRQADLPGSASFVECAGRGLVDVPVAIAERWAETAPGSTGPHEGAVRQMTGTLRALVGQGAEGPFHLDLREHGPHALVGGTTGAGKSEFLQSWLLGMAVDHSPQRVTFLLVDYKGGAAFAEVVRLPHTVGLVTDLTPRLVRRALTSLRAEVRHRERILAAAGAPDLLELERRGDPAAPPALVIVVDEFAALVHEVPEFVDGMIDVAQRGRSLGLHLILATQRPAGVIKDNLRANTNLRVALRMADEDDSSDVLGSRDAALFDPGIPGRAMAKTGPGRLTPFQALYAGGRSSAVAPPPAITITPLGFGSAMTWPRFERPDAAVIAGGPTDVKRVVDTIRKGAVEAGVEAPRLPWLPELPAVLDLEALQTPDRRDDELVLGLADDPERQRRLPAGYRPDDDGALVVLGTGGSGKSTVLRSLAISAGLGNGPCQVYGLDFGSRGLTSLETLPHVGSIVTGDDHERVTRLLDQLRATVDERAIRYARVSAGSIGEYRHLAAAPDEHRIILLIDNFAGFRSAYELSRTSRLYDMLPGLALDGRSVGVHVVVTATRPGVIPPGLAAAAKKQVTLRLVQDIDLAGAGLGADAFAVDAPAGRGYIDGQEVQVAVLGGDPDVSVQAAATRSLAARLEQAGTTRAAAVGRLAERIDLSALPPEVAGMPTLGIAQDTLEAMAFAGSGTFLIAGPPQSGRTTALLTAVSSLQRCRPRCRLIYFGPPNSPLTGSTGPAWARIVVAAEEVAEAAAAWTELAGGSSLGVVIENLPRFSDAPAQDALERLVLAMAGAGHVVIADGETSALTSSWGLPKAMKAARHGLLLQPDQTDGESVLRTPLLPRSRRADFPPGRGVYVRSGHVRTVQVALPA